MLGALRLLEDRERGFTRARRGGLVAGRERLEVDRRVDAVLPRALEQDAEELLAQAVHLVVLDLELGGRAEVALGHDPRGRPDHRVGDPRHVADERLHGQRHGRLGSAAASDLGDVYGEGAHALQVGHHPQGRDELPQVGGDGLLGRQQHQRLRIDGEATFLTYDTNEQDRQMSIYPNFEFVGGGNRFFRGMDATFASESNYVDMRSRGEEAITGSGMGKLRAFTESARLKMTL